MSVQTFHGNPCSSCWDISAHMAKMGYITKIMNHDCINNKIINMDINKSVWRENKNTVSELYTCLYRKMLYHCWTSAIIFAFDFITHFSLIKTTSQGTFSWQYHAFPLISYKSINTRSFQGVLKWDTLIRISCSLLPGNERWLEFRSTTRKQGIRVVTETSPLIIRSCQWCWCVVLSDPGSVFFFHWEWKWKQSSHGRNVTAHFIYRCLDTQQTEYTAVSEEETCNTPKYIKLRDGWKQCLHYSVLTPLVSRCPHSNLFWWFSSPLMFFHFYCGKQ